MTFVVLQRACRARAKEFLNKKTNGPEPVFDAQRIVVRETVEVWIREFLDNDKVAMVLVGEPGVGKTFTLCQMTNSSLANAEQLVLPYDADDLMRRLQDSLPTDRLSDRIGQIVAEDLGYPQYTDLLDNLGCLIKSLETEETNLLICFDDVGNLELEQHKGGDFMTSFDNLFAQFMTRQDTRLPRLKFLVTCQDSRWEDIADERRLWSRSYHLREKPNSKLKSFVWSIEGFYDEFETAYCTYTGQDAKQGQYDEVREICQGNPYLLSIAADSIRAGQSVVMRDLLDEFYHRRVRRGPRDQQLKTEKFLLQFAKDYKDHLKGVLASDIDIADEAFGRLVKDGIIKAEPREESPRLLVLKLRPRQLLEYLRSATDTDSLTRKEDIMAQRLPEYKRRALENSRHQLIEEYDATRAQMRRTLSDTDKIKLQRQLESLEQEIEKVDVELGQGQAHMPLQDAKASFDSVPEPDQVYGVGNRWAVLVGVNAYEDHGYYGPLKLCVEDVDAIRSKLIAGGFSPERIRLINDNTVQKPTRANILAALQSVADATEKDDLLLFYYSGHGDVSGGASYLVARDGQNTVLGDTAVSVTRIKQIVDAATAQAKVIVLDACHSGADIGAKGAKPMSSEFIQRVFEQAEGIAILSSCKQGQLSWEWDEKGRGVFSYYLLEAIGGEADRDEKGFVTVQDASRHVTNGVKLWASQRNRSQTPTLQCSVAGDIILTRQT